MAGSGWSTANYLLRTTSIPTGNFSFLAWVKVSSHTAAWRGILFRGDNTGGGELPFFGLNATTDTLHLYNGNDTPGSTALSVNTWHHIAVVRNASNDWKGYLNGVQEISDTVAETAVTIERIEIGRDGASFGNPFLNGTVAGVKIYSTNLTQDEIKQEMRSVLPIRTANLSAFLPIVDNTSANTGVDYGGIANFTVNGTITIAADFPPIPWRAGRRRFVYIPAAGNQNLNAGDQVVTFTAPTATVSPGAVNLPAGDQSVTITVPAALLAAIANLAAGNQTVTITSPSASLTLGAVNLAAGDNIVIITAPVATVSVGGSTQNLDAGDNSVVITAPTASLQIGASNRAAGDQVVTISAPALILQIFVNLLAGGQTVTITAPAATLTAGASLRAAGDNVIVITAPPAAITGGAPVVPWWNALTGETSHHAGDIKELG